MSSTPLAPKSTGDENSGEERPVSLAAGWVFHVVAFVLSVGYLTVGVTTVKFGTLADPGPGFFPMVVGVVAVLGSILAGVRYAIVAPRTAEGRESNLPFLRRPIVLLLIFLGVAAAFLATLEFVGFLISSAWFVAAMMLLAGDRKVTRIVITSVIVAAASDYLFVELLGVPLPYGLWSL
jgi:putative tricarboxylic transport membrane protein